MTMLDKKCSSIGKKFLMALSGAILFAFILGHLAGNLLIFCGPNALNSYAKKLLSLGPGLWAIRIFLITVIFTHIFTSIKVSLENKSARPVPYQHRPAYEQSSYASRTMMASGIILVAFIIYHLLHFTFRITNPDISHMEDAFGRHDVYSMVVLSFQDGLVASSYVIAMALLCMHLSHGIASMFQTLGLTDEKKLRCLQRAGRAFAFVLFLGYASIPLAVSLGFLTVSAPGGIV